MAVESSLDTFGGKVHLKPEMGAGSMCEQSGADGILH